MYLNPTDVNFEEMPLFYFLQFPFEDIDYKRKSTEHLLVFVKTSRFLVPSNIPVKDFGIILHLSFSFIIRPLCTLQTPRK